MNWKIWIVDLNLKKCRVIRKSKSEKVDRFCSLFAKNCQIIWLFSARGRKYNINIARTPREMVSLGLDVNSGNSWQATLPIVTPRRLFRTHATHVAHSHSHSLAQAQSQQSKQAWVIVGRVPAPDVALARPCMFADDEPTCLTENRCRMGRRGECERRA